MPLENRARLFHVLQQRSFRRGDFVLASGKRSTYYIDCKPTSLSPEGMVLSGEELYRLYREAGLEAAAVAGPSIGADPLVASFVMTAHHHGREVFGLMIRKQAKDHGTGKRVEGGVNLPAGARVVLVEDVVTTGGSSMDSVEALRAEGFQVAAAFALVDRGEGGTERFAAEGIPFRSLFSIKEFLA
jgi:orotate phosphoribosyltransferase